MGTFSTGSLGRMHRQRKQWLAAAALAALPLAAAAQGVSAGAAYVPSNVAQLSAEGSVEVQQDVLRLVLSTTRQGSDAQAVQNQLKQAVDAALKVAQAQARPDAMDVHTGNFSLYPSHDRNGKISQWQGSAEVVLSGKDMARISSTAGRIASMTVANAGFDISKELRRDSEMQAQKLAIDAFRDKAQSITRSFGFSSYTLREVSINSEGGYGAPRMMAMKASADMESAPVPVAPGKSTVRMVVNGSVQMR